MGVVVRSRPGLQAALRQHTHLIPQKFLVSFTSLKLTQRHVVGGRDAHTHLADEYTEAWKKEWGPLKTRPSCGLRWYHFLRLWREQGQRPDLGMWRAREVRDGLKEAKEEELALSSEVSDFWPDVSSCAGLDPSSRQNQIPNGRVHDRIRFPELREETFWMFAGAN